MDTYPIITIPAKKLAEFLGIDSKHCIFDVNLDSWTGTAPTVKISVCPVQEGINTF